MCVRPGRQHSNRRSRCALARWIGPELEELPGFAVETGAVYAVELGAINRILPFA